MSRFKAEKRGLLHRVVDRVRPGALRLLGDHRIGAAGEQFGNGAIGILEIKLAVARLPSSLAISPIICSW